MLRVKVSQTDQNQCAKLEQARPREGLVAPLWFPTVAMWIACPAFAE